MSATNRGKLKTMIDGQKISDFGRRKGVLTRMGQNPKGGGSYDGYSKLSIHNRNLQREKDKARSLMRYDAQERRVMAPLKKELIGKMFKDIKFQFHRPNKNEWLTGLEKKIDKFVTCIANRDAPLKRPVRMRGLGQRRHSPRRGTQARGNFVKIPSENPKDAWSQDSPTNKPK
jgi:hypothetical protein